MAKFIVDRKTWYRGHGSKGSKLFRKDDGMRCCIGFVGQQIGIPDSNLERGGVISHMFRAQVESAWPGWMKRPNGDIYLAYSINDAAGITDETREAQLKEIFERNGDEIEFIN